MAVPIIPNIVEWTIVPQKGTTTFYDDMNVWLAQTNTVVNSWNTTLNSTNAVYQDINFIYNQIRNADPTSGYSQAYTNRSQIAGYSEYKAVGAEISVLTADNTNLQLYKNDVLLILATDYTLNIDGVTVDLVAPLILDDLVQWYDLNKLKNSFYTKDEVYTKTETINKFIDKDINALTSKTTPADADELILGDSALSFSLKKLTWGNLKNTLNTFFDTLYVKAFSTLTTQATTDASNRIIMAGIGSIEGLEIGDVILLSGFSNAKNNSSFTVETIEDANNIKVNIAHAGMGTKKDLAEETSSSVTVRILAKYYNAQIGLGQGYLDVSTMRTANVSETNTTGRTITAVIGGNAGSVTIDTLVAGGLSGVSDNTTAFPIPSGSSYFTAQTPSRFHELR